MTCYSDWEGTFRTDLIARHTHFALLVNLVLTQIVGFLASNATYGGEALILISFEGFLMRQSSSVNQRSAVSSELHRVQFSNSCLTTMHVGVDHH